jgi:hypothetical protein
MKAYTEDRFGWSSVFFGYVLGSYFIAILLFIGGFHERELFAAPFLLPFYLVIGLLLTGDTTGLLWSILIWCLAVVGCWGLWKAWIEKAWAWWPFSLVLVLDALLVFYFWLRR